jgi:predicted ATP-grasp superfamily ATP-dependent carboligase
MVPRRRHSSTAPNEGHVLFEAPELEAIGRNVVHALDMSWLFDIDFMMNGAGEPIILEINPRASGSVSVGMSAGVPLMDDLISLVLGERPPVAQVPFGQRVYAYQTLGVR